MEPETSADEATTLADRHSDDVAAIHRVASLPPGDPNERLIQLLDAGCAAVSVTLGFVLLRSPDGLTVRARVGPDATGPALGSVVSDWRLDDVLARQATVASLGGPGAPADHAPLGQGALVACPLWVTGRVAGVVAFANGTSLAPFSSWQLGLVDLVADGAARILEHEADIRAMVRLESQAQAMIDLIPDPVVRVRRDGQQLADDGDEVLGVFDPTAPMRLPGTPADPATLKLVQQAVVAALDTGRLQTGVYAPGPGLEARRVEARFVPAGHDTVLCIVRDVTERHQAELALAEQVAFEALVASISTRLIGCAPDLLDDAIEVGLGEIASFFNADTAFIDELDADGSTLRVSHQWARHQVVSTRTKGQKVDLKGFGWLTARFERAGHVFARGPATIPREATEQALVDARDKGVLWVRLGYGGELVGVLGLTWRTHEPPPSDEVLGLVRFAADAFLGALRRRSVALLADGQAEVFELIARGAPVATAILAARSLLERHTLGASVVIATVEDDGRLSLIAQPDEEALASWFASLEPGLGNPFGQAVMTGEPVMVANAYGDPRYRDPVLPEGAFQSATIVPVRSPRTGQTLAVVGLLGGEPGAPVARPAVRDSVVSLVTVAVERSIDERLLAHQATHDPLTGVGNRAALLDRLTLGLARARRSGRAVAVLFCDLDGFKAVNDQFGHDRGDRLLVEVAERIGHAVRPSDTVCRTGGDEFVIVCEDLAGPDQADIIAARVRTAIEDIPVDGGEHHLSVGVSVGVAVADLAIDDPDRLLRTADLAMYAHKQARRAGRPVVAVKPAPAGTVDPHPADPFRTDLAAAIEDDELHLVHQPLVSRDGTLAGVEAIVAWDHPVLGTVGADRLASVVADGNLAGALGGWVRRAALAARGQWMAHVASPGAIPVHVHVVAAELVMDSFTDAVLADLNEAGVDPDAIVFEVGEHDLTDPGVRSTVAGLTAAGITVLVETAGEGGLSLTDLAGHAVRGLKLGPALVTKVRADDPVGIEVARSLVILAHGLGWRCVAAGVDTDHQRAVLFGFGIDAVQGKVVTVAANDHDLVAWLDRRLES